MRIQTEKIFSEQKCQEISRQILNSKMITETLLAERVIKFGPAFYANKDSYDEMIAIWRDEMAQYSKIFEEVREWLSEKMGFKIIFHPRLAQPGFHIYHNTLPQGSLVHFDYWVHQVAPRLGPEQNFGQVYSLSLMLNRPDEGGALNFWDANITDFAKSWGDLKRPPPTPEHIIDLQLGEGVVFESQKVHQVGALRVNDLSRARVTLVGHIAEMISGEYVFFW